MQFHFISALEVYCNNYNANSGIPPQLFLTIFYYPAFVYEFLFQTFRHMLPLAWSGVHFAPFPAVGLMENLRRFCCNKSTTRVAQV